MNNVSQTLSKKMCCGCGACYSICPKECIEFIEGEYVNYPKINKDKCIDCGLCMKVCPGQMNAERLVNNNKINIKSNIKEIKVAYSTDEELRNKSASGGMITQIIKSMLESGKIDAAVVVTQNKDNVLHNSIEIIENVDDLMKSQGSRYSPSSNCIALKEVLEDDKYNKIAFVGKPCDIEALSSFEDLNKKMKNKIAVKISIMCHHSPTRKGLINLLNAKNLKVKNIKKISFRGNGWPGLFKVVNSDGKNFSTSYFDAWNNYLSQDDNEKCNYCENPFPLQADFIIGDPWGDEYKDDNEGQSLIIIRSSYGLEIIKELEASNKMVSKNVTYEDVERYQKFLLIRHNEFKLNSLIYREVHGYKNSISDYIRLAKENPKDLLRYFKRMGRFKKAHDEWEYK